MDPSSWDRLSLASRMAGAASPRQIKAPHVSSTHTCRCDLRAAGGLIVTESGVADRRERLVRRGPHQDEARAAKGEVVSRAGRCREMRIVNAAGGDPVRYLSV